MTRLNRTLVAACLGVLSACATFGCGGGGSGPGTSDDGGWTSGVPTFTVSPMNFSDFNSFSRLGNLNPPAGHIQPSDHGGFGVQDINTKYPVFAPGDGTVVGWMGGPNGNLYVRATKNFYYYFDHIVVAAGIETGSQLKAGHLVGTTVGLPGQGGLDFGAYDTDTQLPGFVNPARYASKTLQTVFPLAYFQEPLRSALYSRVQSPWSPHPWLESTSDGKIDFDVAGTLAGNWFLQGLPVEESFSKSAWTKQLTFLYNPAHPESEGTISVGGTVAPAGLGSKNISPMTVTSETGPVSYSYWVNGAKYTLLVQMVEKDKIRVEAIPAEGTPFSGQALYYVR